MSWIMLKLFNLWQAYGNGLTSSALYALMILIPVLCAAVYLTYFERKIIAYIQLRQGPNVVGPFGLLQPFADGLKLMHKENIVPRNAYPLIFRMAPVLMFGCSLGAWAVIPWGPDFVFSNLKFGLLYLMALSSLSVYGVIFAGWASRSRYAFLGGMRSVAQMISYELVLSSIFLIIVLCTGSMNLNTVVESQRGLWFIFPHFPIAIIFLIAGLGEVNRTPFDLPEAESELVGGYHVEYSSLSFALFFLCEYANMILLSVLMTILFFGGWLPPFAFAPFTWFPGFFWMALKMSFFLFLFIWLRATLPRYRYDQFMRLGWKVLLPVVFLWFLGSALFIGAYRWGV
jgi:NADH-quinone oxidoreductase subunit H